MSRTIRRDRLVGVLATLTLVAAGCGGGGKTATQTASSSVTPEAGGTVTLPGNAAVLEIPAGAVTGTTMITVSTTTDKPPAGITAASPILKFEPDGLVFEKPVTVTFTFKNATHPVVYWSNAQGGYGAIGGTVSGTTIAAEVTHFSSGFVGEAAGGTATCAEGLACNGAATCTYGSGGNLSPGGDTNTGSAPDPGTSGGTSGTGTSAPPATGGNTAPIDPGTSPAGVSSALTSSMCCACAKDGLFHCGPCPTTCAEGAACGTEGWMCNAATNTGLNPAPMSGDTSGTAPKDPAGAPAATSALSSADTCCLCGSDGKFHCGMACVGGGAPKGDGGTNTGTPPISGGLDGGGSNAGSKCEPGAACAPGSGDCGSSSSGGGCLMCHCGADGKYACDACPSNGTAGAGGGPIDPGTGGTCEPGAACAPGSGDCGSSSSGGGCLMCHCGADGKYACDACTAPPKPDGGTGATSPPDGGVPPPPPPPEECLPGAPCAQVGVGCGGSSPAGGCMKCMCAADLKYACMPCTPPPG